MKKHVWNHHGTYICYHYLGKPVVFVRKEGKKCFPCCKMNRKIIFRDSNMMFSHGVFVCNDVYWDD